MPSEKTLIGLRVDDQLRDEVSAIAARELRSVSNMVEILLRAGLRDFHARTGVGLEESANVEREELAILEGRRLRARQIDISEQIARKVKAGPVRKK